MLLASSVPHAAFACNNRGDGSANIACIYCITSYVRASHGAQSRPARRTSLEREQQLQLEVDLSNWQLATGGIVV
ncbi:hypothetical protein ACLKA7_003098 [Drosophila subpalustris]